jgi:hypothetical protein
MTSNASMPAGESVHRTATLEDVFVLLTGEVLQ